MVNLGQDEVVMKIQSPFQIYILFCALCLGLTVWTHPLASRAHSQTPSAVHSASQSLEFTKRSLSPSEVSTTSEVGVELDEATEIMAPSMAGSHFVEFESTFGHLKTASGEYLGFERIDLPTDRGVYASEIVRLLRGRTVQAVGGHPLPVNWVQPAQQIPTVPGFRYVSGNRIIARADSHRYVGLWQAERGNETLVIAFDEPSSDHPSRPVSQILASLPFKATVISTTSAPHGGPTSLRLVTDPDQDGRFWLVNLVWPTA